MAAAEELDAIQHSRLLAEEGVVARQRGDALLLRLAERLYFIVDSRDRDRAIVIDEPSQYFRKRHRRVGHRAAPHPAVHGLLERLHLDVDDDDSAQRGRYRRQAGIEIAGIGEDDG